MLKVAVLSAGVQEAHGVTPLLENVRESYPDLCLIWADGGYNFATARVAADSAGVELKIVPKPEGQKGFQPLPRRWVVERTFAWLVRYRRLRCDYETRPESSRAYIWLAMSHLMARRLVRS